jgi:hypothetical protein
MTAQEIENSVIDFLTAKLIKYVVVKVGENTDANNWKHDLWMVSFQRAGKKEVFTTSFKTGTGLRKKSRISPAAPFPVAPNAACVLYSLVMDSEAINGSFDNWCSNFGYDSDSIKALNTYQECCKIGKEFNKLFDRTELEALREMLQDY